jgi:uncharacterized membrane protein
MPKYCNSCGAAVVDVARFCNKCGTPFQPTQPSSSPQATAPPPSSPGYQAPPSGYQHPQYAAPQSAGGLQPNVAGLLCYVLGLVTGIIFLVLDPYNKDRFVRFHAFQSIFLSAAMFALIFAVSIMLGILYLMLPWGLYALLRLGLNLLQLGGFVLWIFSMFKAYNNEKWKIPVIGELAERQAER